jgi:hypothetical protein
MLIVIIFGLATHSLQKKWEAKHGTPSQPFATFVSGSDATLQSGAYTLSRPDLNVRVATF